MKYPILQKLHESIFPGSCVKLTSAGSTTACHSSHLTVTREAFTQASSLGSLHAHLRLAVTGV